MDRGAGDDQHGVTPASAGDDGVADDSTEGGALGAVAEDFAGRGEEERVGG